jgi:hypothetical protein
MKNEAADWTRNGLNKIWNIICARAWKFGIKEAKTDLKKRKRPLYIFRERDAWKNSRNILTVRPLCLLWKGKYGAKIIYVSFASLIRGIKSTCCWYLLPFRKSKKLLKIVFRYNRMLFLRKSVKLWWTLRNYLVLPNILILATCRIKRWNWNSFRIYGIAQRNVTFL